MIGLVTLSLALATVCAAPQQGFGFNRDKNAVALVHERYLHPDGSYTYKYETSNGISASQSGSANGVFSNGYYSYNAPTGERIQLTYIADEYGFHPQGTHLPVEPPAPDHVIRSLQAIRAAATPNSNLDIRTLDATIARLKANRG
ncbi:pupal cuticle protein Edg-78E-like [Toxorhynchites rutilus septentrionalis]|uniref:pupal cuticle protein Edg-78E-like n=1 Tax=Toxorhynchites rutilus septentrionalis TaxID=329112 RepID=UPI00247B1AAD|nr:pupal cuticle protein Edg-78E-like [Toxorhynchites rutilus septentrionalis]